MSAPANNAKANASSQANSRLVKKLIFMVFGMFAFGWALIPLYDLLCEIT